MTDQEPGKEKRRVSIATKMYVFVAAIVVMVGLGTTAIAYRAQANQIDSYYKQNTADNARNFASMVDGDFLRELEGVAASEEFQAIRDAAEEAGDEAPVEAYLREAGLWEQYSETREQLSEYLRNMDGIKYLYIIAHGDKDALEDMYLIDDDENPIYETGYYEEREETLRGIDLTDMPEPTISYGDWGWLCSDFKPVYDSNGEAVCIVGCDIGMDELMTERRRLLAILVTGMLVFTSVVLAISVFFINRAVVRPLNAMTGEMKKFAPSQNADYEQAGVINMNIRSNDEIGEIYHGIRDMQISIIDYLRDLIRLQEDKARAEHDLQDKEKEIGKLSEETYRDALTHVGSKAFYVKKSAELNERIAAEQVSFAVVMVDMNNLKGINDVHGHEAGDEYIMGCCHMVCEAFRHSPVFRVGGDEFVALLTGGDYENRRKIVDRLRADFRTSYEKTDRDPWLRYSAAVGIADSTPEDESVEPVLKRADEAMYEDKAAFKNLYGGEVR